MILAEIFFFGGGGGGGGSWSVWDIITEVIDGVMLFTVSPIGDAAHRMIVPEPPGWKYCRKHTKTIEIFYEGKDMREPIHTSVSFPYQHEVRDYMYRYVSSACRETTKWLPSSLVAWGHFS